MQFDPKLFLEVVRAAQNNAPDATIEGFNELQVIAHRLLAVELGLATGSSLFSSTQADEPLVTAHITRPTPLAAKLLNADPPIDELLKPFEIGEPVNREALQRAVSTLRLALGF